MSVWGLLPWGEEWEITRKAGLKGGRGAGEPISLSQKKSYYRMLGLEC